MLCKKRFFTAIPFFGILNCVSFEQNIPTPIMVVNKESYLSFVSNN